MPAPDLNKTDWKIISSLYELFERTSFLNKIYLILAYSYLPQKVENSILLLTCDMLDWSAFKFCWFHKKATMSGDVAKNTILWQIIEKER